jgi:Na+/proline symporter
MDILILTFVVLVFLMINGYFGYIAWRRTKNADDSLVKGRDTHPFIMVLSYGATFISTAMPLWFMYLFMIILFKAAMSTLSAQFHVKGTAIGRDVYETVVRKTGGSSVDWLELA